MSKDDKEILRMSMERFEEECNIDYTKPIDYPTPVISFGEKEYQTKEGVRSYPIPIGTYGNFSFIQAPPKTKKTFFVSLLVSTYLFGSISGTTGALKGHRNNNKHVVHFDTEQGDWHAQKVFHRPLEMSNEEVENYHTLALRRLSYRDRIDFIEYYLYDKLEGKDIGLVIIDGIADLCSDVNNIEEANYVVQKIMTWTAELNCHIITVIHSNFGNEKATGHLGSFLYKKTETAISLKENTANKGNITVNCKMSRNYGFENFDFNVTKYGLPQIQGAVYDLLKDIDFG